MTTPPPPDAARAAFEAAFKSEGENPELLERNSRGYINPGVESGWRGFRAAYRLMAKDAERLDFIERNGCPPFSVSTQIGRGPNDFRFDGYACAADAEPLPTIREAIDAAMSAVKGEKG